MKVPLGIFGLILAFAGKFIGFQVVFIFIFTVYEVNKNERMNERTNEQRDICLLIDRAIEMC